VAILCRAAMSRQRYLGVLPVGDARRNLPLLLLLDGHLEERRRRRKKRKKHVTKCVMTDTYTSMIGPMVRLNHMVENK